MNFLPHTDPNGNVNIWRIYRGNDGYLYIVTGISAPVDAGLLNHLLDTSEVRNPLDDIKLEWVEANRKYFSGMYTISIYPLGRTLDDNHLAYKTGSYRHSKDIYSKDLVIYKRLCDLNTTNVTYVRPLEEFAKVVSVDDFGKHLLFEQVLGYIDNDAPYTKQDIVQPKKPPSKIDKFWGLGN